VIGTSISSSSPSDDLRTKISPLLLSLQNAANDITDPVYLFIDPKREQAAALGRFVLRLAAVSGESFGATPESTLSIYFPRELLSLSDVRAIQLEPASAEGWTLVLPSENDAPLILKPRRAFTISRDQPQTISLSQVLATSGEPIKLRTITFDWKNFTGLTDDFIVRNATRELPPAAADKDANLEAKWGPRSEYNNAADTVYITPYTIGSTTPGIANRLILRIGNREEGELQNNRAEFTVTFPTTKSGDARSALCTPEQLSRVQCIQVAPVQNRWQIEPITDSEILHWILRPPANATTIFGQDNYVSFEFSNLVTEMMLSPCAAVMSWSGIKARKSGARRVALEKALPIPTVIVFNAHSGTRVVPHGDTVNFKEPITLSWSLFAADACRVQEGEDNALGAQLTLKPGDTKVVLPTNPNTVYTLTPSITLNGSPTRGTGIDKQFRIHPSTAKLRADPDRLVPSSTDTAETLPTRTTLHWECASGDCFLSGPGLSRIKVDPVGQLPVTAGLQQYKIECIGLATATATAKVALPPPFVKFNVESIPNGGFRLIWKSAYAEEVQVSSGSGTLSRELNGRSDVHSEQVLIQADGAARTTVEVIITSSPASFPDITAIAYIGPNGPIFRYAATSTMKIFVVRPNGGMDGPLAASGEVSIPDVGASTDRSMMVLFANMSDNNLLGTAIWKISLPLDANK
jgi:hypothetical protein